MIYRHIAVSENAFVQQLAVAYVNHGYWYYVTGIIPGCKDVEKVDQKLIEKYNIAISKWARARRKKQGRANVHYLRHRHFFVLVATRGTHHFFREEGENIKNIKYDPIHFSGYSISYKQGMDRKWHASVRIHPVMYTHLKSYFLDMATCRSLGQIRIELLKLPFEPYAPVRRQLLNIVRAVNRARLKAGFEPVPIEYLRLKRHVLKPFTEETAVSNRRKSSSS
jgi:hypothetical protein